MNWPLQISISAIIGLLSFFLAARQGKNPYFWFTIGFVFGLFGVLAFFFAPIFKKKPTVQQPIPQPYIDGPTDCFWYYLDPSQEQKGPVSHNALTEAWKKGELTPATYVWYENLPEWKQLQDLIKFKH